MLLLWAFKFIFMPTGIENYEIAKLFPTSLGFRLSSQYLSAFIGFLIFYFFATLLIKVNADLQIVSGAYQSPGLIFAILSGYFINIQQFNNILISSLLVFMAILIIFYSINKFIALETAYNSGLIFALAFLFYPKVIYFLPLLIISFFLLKTIEWREIAVLLLGILTPLVIFYTSFWLFGDFQSIWLKTKISLNQNFLLSRYSSSNNIIFAPFIVLVILTLSSRFVLKLAKKNNSIKLQTALLIYIAYTITLFLSPLMPDEIIALIYPALSIILASIIITSKSKLSYIYLIIIFASVLFSQLFQIYFYLSVF